MNTTTKLALAFTTLAAFAGIAYAEKGPEGADRKHIGGMGFDLMSLEKMDADKTGDVTFEEFKKAAGDRFLLADTDKDGKVTVEEMAAAIEKVRLEKMAKRVIHRFDVDGDGAITQAEIETNQQEVYALLDRNNDGKLVQEEIQRKKDGWFNGKGHKGPGDND